MTEARIQDLLGKPYQEPEGCWTFARAVLARMGLALPATSAEALAGLDAIAVEVLAPYREGDLVELASDGGGHVGVMLDPFRFVHAFRGGPSRPERLCTWERAQKVKRVVRLRGAAA